MTVSQNHWMNSIEDSSARLYTWLPDGSGREAVDVAMSFPVTDILHVRRRTGISREIVPEDAAARSCRE